MNAHGWMNEPVTCGTVISKFSSDVLLSSSETDVASDVSEDIMTEFSDESASELFLPESSQEQKSAVTIIAHKTTDKIFLHMNYTSIMYVA